MTLNLFTTLMSPPESLLYTALYADTDGSVSDCTTGLRIFSIAHCCVYRTILTRNDIARGNCKDISEQAAYDHTGGHDVTKVQQLESMMCHEPS